MPLLKDKISKLTFNPKAIDQSLNEAYFAAKYGKFTSSEFHYLMGEKEIGKTGMNYIYRKVGEELAQRSSKPDFTSVATDHGLDYEMEGIAAFGQWLIDNEKTNKDIDIRTQKLIIDGQCGGTPDGIWVTNETELDITVRTIECKCPYSFDAYIRLWKCQTPADVKKLERDGSKYFYQCIHQMALTGALYGYLVAYMPLFSAGKLRVITFDATQPEIREEIKKVNQRALEATQIFNQVRQELINS